MGPGGAANIILRGEIRRPCGAPDARTVACIIPGVLRKVCVKEGDVVAKGQVLLELE